MANERGSWGASCYLEEECGTWLACDGGAGSVGGKCMVLQAQGLGHWWGHCCVPVCSPNVEFLFVFLLSTKEEEKRESKRQ